MGESIDRQHSVNLEPARFAFWARKTIIIFFIVIFLGSGSSSNVLIAENPTASHICVANSQLILSARWCNYSTQLGNVSGSYS